MGFSNPKKAVEFWAWIGQRFCVALSGLQILFHLIQGGTDPSGSACPGLVCLAPLGLLSLRDIKQILLSITKLRTLTRFSKRVGRSQFYLTLLFAFNSCMVKLKIEVK